MENLIPKIPININYCKKQLENMRLNIAPPMYLKDNNEKCDKNWSEDDLSDFQKKLLLIKT